MKKYLLFVFLFLSFILLGCDRKKIELIVHEKDKILIAPEEEKTIKASFDGDLELEWILLKGNTSIEISPDTRSAKITGLYDGVETLSISPKGLPNLKKEIRIYVYHNPEINFNTNKEMSPEQTLSIVESTRPSFIMNDLEFSSSDENIATVNNEGIVTAVLPGIVTISATSNSTGVSGKTTIYIKGTYKVSIFGKSEVIVGEDNLYTSQIYDRDCNQEVNWSISDSEYGFINKEGLLRTVKSGKFKIYATSVENNKLIGELEITTIVLPSKISVEFPSRILIGDKINLKYTIDPLLASKDVLITSSNPSVISVNVKGQLVANSRGSTTITVTSLVDSNIYFEKYLKVEDMFLSLKGNDSLTIGITRAYIALYFGKRTDDVIWESSDSNIATVSSTGIVTPINYGTFILKAISKKNNNLIGHKEIQVYDLPTEVSYIGPTILINNRRTELIVDARSSNGNLVDQSEFFFTSSDTDVVSVESNNYLYAKNEGIVTIDIYSTLINISSTQEIIVTKYNNKSNYNNRDYILVTKSKKINEIVKYKDKLYLYGYTAFDDLEEALNMAKEGTTIFVVNGYFSNKYSISKDNITLIGDNATISNSIYVKENVKGLTIDGFKFTNMAVINFDENGGIEDFTFKNNIIYDNIYYAHSNEGFLSFPVFKYKANKNFEIINNKLFISKDPYTYNRGFINGGNIINITIIGNYIEGRSGNYRDAIKLEGDHDYDGNGIGASGIVRINNNYFNKISKNGISISRYSADSIDIKNNIFDSCGGTSAIMIDKWGNSENTEINIKYNVFKNMNSSFGIWFGNISIVKGSSWSVNINYNKFINFVNPSNTVSKFIYSLAEKAKDFINANNNYFDTAYTDRIVNVGKYSIQFETEADLDNLILLGN